MTRQGVVEAARTLFAANGDEQTTVPSIAREARVPPPPCTPSAAARRACSGR